AVLLPFLGFTFCVTLDYARIYHQRQTLQTCAESAALYAAGACSPPAYAPPDAGLVGTVGATLQSLLGFQGAASSTASSTSEREEQGRQAAVADGASLNPPLRPEQVAFRYDGNCAIVTVTYSFSFLTPMAGSAQELSVTVSLPMLPQ